MAPEETAHYWELGVLITGLVIVIAMAFWAGN
jgi:hypothetical protein